jgi:hypothetical protein
LVIVLEILIRRVMTTLYRQVWRADFEIGPVLT